MLDKTSKVKMYTHTGSTFFFPLNKYHWDFIFPFTSDYTDYPFLLLTVPILIVLSEGGKRTSIKPIIWEN